MLDSRRITGVLQSRKPRLVVTDVNIMPDFDGIKVIRAVKAFNPATKVIAFTAVGTLDTEVKAREAGCNACFTKSMNVREFRQF